MNSVDKFFIYAFFYLFISGLFAGSLFKNDLECHGNAKIDNEILSEGLLWPFLIGSSMYVEFSIEDELLKNNAKKKTCENKRNSY